MQRVTEAIVGVLGSRRFFYVVLAFFGLSGLWVALSAVFPMAFDEEFHLGIIRVYSGHWLPFLGGQPDGADAYGAVAADPSYLYHYVMSFPYRIIALFTDNEMVQVILLRFINVGLFGLGLVLFRKVLLRAGTSPALTHGAILLFVLIPIVPLLAGQINYDNALLPLVAWVCLLVLQLTEKLRAREVDLKLFCLLIIACLLTSVVKYAFLPIALAVGIFLAFMLWRAFRGRSKQLQKALQKSHNKLTNRAKVLLLVGLLLAAGLFVQRYGVNTISYGTPMPPCHEVIGVDACMSYGPWARNYLYEADKGEFNHSPFAHTWTWLQGLHYRLFFMITGPDGGYTNYPPSPLPSAAAVLIVIFGGLAAVFYWRRVFMGRPFLVFLLLMSAVYIGVLWFENYTQFLETGRPVAINGRYLLPLLLPLAAVFGRALGIALKPWPVIRAAAAAVVILLFVQGGGIFSFILYSDEAWYWPNRTIINANNAAQKTLDPIILQGPKQY